LKRGTPTMSECPPQILVIERGARVNLAPR
jgi:hypothetical protein